VGDQVLASPAGGPQGHGSRAVGHQRAQPGPVGAEGVGEDEGVEAVVLVAGRAVAGAQVLELVGADDDDGQAGLEEALHDRTVGPFDGDLVGPVLGEPADQVADASGGVGDGEPLDHLAASIDDGDGVVVASPVHASGPVTRPGGRKGGLRRMLHISLLAAGPSGEAPYSRCRDAAASPLTVRRSTALSPSSASRPSAGDGRSRRGTAATRSCARSHAPAPMTDAARTDPRSGPASPQALPPTPGGLRHLRRPPPLRVVTHPKGCGGRLRCPGRWARHPGADSWCSPHRHVENGSPTPTSPAKGPSGAAKHEEYATSFDHHHFHMVLRQQQVIRSDRLAAHEQAARVAQVLSELWRALRRLTQQEAPETTLRPRRIA